MKISNIAYRISHIIYQREFPQFCFLKPCITERELYFVGSEQEPCDDNSNIRKEIYKPDWRVMNNAGGWNDPR